MPFSNNINTSNDNIYTVSRLNRAAKSLLETNLGVIWLSGEISNLTMAVSGHWYFTLKDHSAQVKCAMFKGSNRYTGFTPKYGQQVLVRGKLSLYEARGDYQLIVDSMQPEGDGRLKQQFEQLKNQLASEGLFSEKTKKPLPQIIKRIGIVTSSTGAALHDILSILERRDPRLHVIIYPSVVQGVGGAESIGNQINLANERSECDLLIVGRGGGSLEDLWNFNEPQVAYAIYHSQLPIISAVGHEIDVTIADYVADIRAATPSAAAELVSQNKVFVETQLNTQRDRLKQAMMARLEFSQHQSALLKEQLLKQDPNHKLQQQTQYLDELTLRLQHAMKQTIANKQQHAQYLHNKLIQHGPARHIEIALQKQQQLNHQLKHEMQQILQQCEIQLQNNAAQLNAVSPLATLARGYSITKDKHQHVITNSEQVNCGDEINIHLLKGQIKAVVL
ncbi:MAG TPA: exodeoxyribonuclease VII large subunit [Psychromonas hadalis]|nr:exodeoxyribonuclease VII large subunit [Psychromonas hadalis]